MNRLFYSLLLYLLSPIIGIYFIYRGFHAHGYWKNWSERLGLVPREIIESRSKNSNCIHLHCASVGEVKAAIPLLKALLNHYPQSLLLITTNTPTGREELQKFANEINSSPFTNKGALIIRRIAICYLPIDWPSACRRFINRVKPTLSLFMETELWPNLIDHLSHRNITSMLVNARMSDRSMKNYTNFPAISRPMFQSLNHVAAQFESDKINLISLGCHKEKISLIGSVKFDINISAQLKEEQKQIKQSWCGGSDKNKDRPCWIAASIHPAEFEIILNTHAKLLSLFPNLLLIAVPRHPEKFTELKSICNKKNITFVNRSEKIVPSKDHSVVIGDTMGELMLLFGVANIAFMGGSLIERGGHNPIEPVACGLPVIMGNSDYNFSDVCKILQLSGVLNRVDGECQLVESTENLLSDRKLLKQKSEACCRIVQENEGPIDRLLKVIEAYFRLHAKPL